MVTIAMHLVASLFKDNSFEPFPLELSGLFSKPLKRLRPNLFQLLQCRDVLIHPD
jgi:hypothetical protein